MPLKGAPGLSRKHKSWLKRLAQGQTLWLITNICQLWA